VNVPNLITTVRLLLLPVFLTLLVYRLTGPALAVLIAAALSDALDGLIARRLNQKTSIGSFLDPLADKLLSVSGFVALTVLGPIPAWFVIVVISRDVIISLGSLVLYIHDGRLEIAPSLTGKAAMLCQFLALVLTLLVQITGRGESAWFWLLVATAALTVASGVQYLWRGLSRAGTKPAA
jgi:cardiolipin synthase (CMP-forming)